MDTQSPEQSHVFDNPRNVRRVLISLFVACGMVFSLDLLDLVLPWFGLGNLRHAENDWDGLPGFYAFYGFIACVVLVLIAKRMRRILMREEDYYDR